jgi:hypothetical protein
MLDVRIGDQVYFRWMQNPDGTFRTCPALVTEVLITPEHNIVNLAVFKPMAPPDFANWITYSLAPAITTWTFARP